MDLKNYAAMYFTADNWKQDGSAIVLYRDGMEVGYTLHEYAKVDDGVLIATRIFDSYQEALLSWYTSDEFARGNLLEGELSAIVEQREIEVDEDVFKTLPVVVVTADGQIVKEIVQYS